MVKTRTKRRKKLDVSLDEFYLLASLEFGPPDPAARTCWHYDGYRNWFGVHAWLRYTERGKEFMALVRSRGEAKCRAKLLYNCYARWYGTQQEPKP